MIYKNKKIKAGLLLAFLFLFALGQNASAATVTAVATGNWADAATWSSGAAPALGDDVVIPTGITVTIAANVLAANAPRTITINGTGSLATGGNDLYVAQNAAGGIYINGTSATAFNATGANDLIIGTATFAGNLHNLNTGTVNLTGATVTMSGTLTNSEDGTLTTTAATLLTLNGSAAVVLPDEIAALHSLTVIKAGSSVTLTADLTVAAAGTLGITSGTLIVGDNDLTVGGATTIAAGATLNANSNETVTRVFTGAITLNGTLLSSGPNVTNTFTGAITFGAAGILNINNSRATIGAAPTFTAGCAIHALGTNLTYTGGAVSFANSTVNTNSNTDLTLSAGGAITNFPPITDLLSLHVTTVNGPTLTANLTVAGNVTIDLAGGLTIGANKLTVNGTFTNTTAAGVVASGSELVLNGPATFTANITTDNATKIIFGGSGAITGFPGATSIVNSLTYNRPLVTTTLTAQVITFDGTTPTFNVSNGTLVAAVDNQFTDDANTITTIGANGTIDFVTFDNVFLGSVAGDGTIDADQVTTTGLAFSGPYSFTGNFKTNATTEIIFNTHASDVSLNSSITELNLLTFNRAGQKITLNNDLTITAATSFDAGELDVNGYTLTFLNTYTNAGVNAWTLTARNSSLVFVGAATFVAATAYNIDETTNLEFQATPTLIATITECNNFTLKTAGNVTLLAGLDIHGNLTVGAGCTLDKATFNLTVYGDVSNAGTMTLSGAGGIVTLYGSLQGEGTYTTDETTDIVVKGTDSQLILPYSFGATAIGNLTIDRPSGVKLNNNLDLGAAAVTGVLTITKGNLDLNGYVLTLARTGAASALIVETPGNTIINTGASGDNNGYITLTSTDLTDIEPSGIGVLLATGGGATTVRRYPITIPVPDVGLSTSRVFYIENTDAVSDLTLQYDNAELYSNPADLEVYMSPSFSFATSVNVSDEANVTTASNLNTPVSGVGNVAVAGTVAVITAGLKNYYALAALPSDGGVMKKFAVASGNWGEAANWTPTGVPSKFDQAVIGASTVYLNGNGNIYECKVLNMNHAQAELKPTDNGINGDNVSLRVMGNVTVIGGAEILGVNGYGKLSLIVGDGVTAGVSSTITTNNDYVPTSGIWIHNLTINMAEVNFAQANEIRVSGNVSLMNNTFLDGTTNDPNLVFWGGYGNQTITIPMSAAAQFHTLKFDNDAYVTTTASFDIKNQFTVKDGSSFIAQNGFITFPGGADTKAWEVEEGGTLKLFNVVFNDNAVGPFTYAPVGTAYIQGDFTKSGQSLFTPAGTTIFSNNSQREIVNASADNELIFDKLHIAEGAKVVTSTSWQVASEIDVKSNASLIADNGVISFVGGANQWIKNASTHTLEFYDLNIGAGTVYTNDSWTIHGNLVLVGNLIANNGTITFDNYQEKSINNGGNLSFFKLLVADGSKLTTNTAHNFTIANSAAYPTGAGIEVQGTGQFYVGDAAAVTTFDVTGPGLAAGFPKTITKSEAGKLEFGNLVIAATPNNEVTTASDFTITGTATTAYNNKGAGAKFLATAGTVTFTAAAPEIESVSPAVSQFYNILGKGGAGITFPNAGQEIMIAGDLVLNDQSTIAPSANVNNKVIFNGSGTQYIKGNTITIDAVQFGDLQINKANNSELILEIDAAIAQNDDHELTLTSGILNLGDKTFTVGAGIISRHNGVINGNAGTLIANSATDPIWLSDVYFTIDGNPTLYNLTVNTAHETANDLTVNGNLHLIADLTIASGLDYNNPKLLTLYGDLSRTAGVIDGDPANSRLVLTGTGTVENGLSNAYFQGGVTTAQLEVARQETLGGDLNIAATSHLRVNSGINNFDLGTNTLTFVTDFNCIMISGGIKAGTGSTVVLPAVAKILIPPSMFRDEECYNLTIAADLTIGGNLRVNGTLAGVFNIFTNDNVLTFGPLATLPAFTDAAHVVGNLKRYVKNNPPTVFNIGGSGDAVMYTPITLQFANSIQGQAVLIKPVYLDPTEERGGDPKYCVDAYFEIIPEGDAPVDSLKAIFQWKTDLDGGTTPSANASFPAKWTGSSWFDYRNKLQPFNVADPRVLTMASFPIGNPAALAGIWGIFNASENTDIAKDRAIATNRNRIAITKVDPSPVKLGLPFKTTVQLQNHLGQPLIAEEAFEVQVQKAQGNGTANLNGTTVTALIQPGKSEVTISGMMFTGTTPATDYGDNFVLKADTTGGSLNWQMGISEPFSVIPAAPTQQAQKIKFTNIKPTSVSIDWAASSSLSNIVVMKANSLLNEDEYPVNATTYLANTIYGAGSTFGDAVVVYNDDQRQVDVTGLAPNTTYYVYVFTYDGEAGYESYNTTAAAGNPNQLVTTGSYDDDITYGINNTRALSKAIGTNTPVRGTIKSDTDEDWFNFTITSASPNLRVKLFNLPENYNVELYDQTGKRVRRSYLQNKYVDAFIMNELSAGTYSVRVYGYNGIFDAVNPYTLQVTTSSSEIFSVTP